MEFLIFIIGMVIGFCSGLWFVFIVFYEMTKEDKKRNDGIEREV